MKKYLIITVLFMVWQSHSQTADIRSKQFNSTNGIGIKGYDPVSYFTDRKAVKGSDNIRYTYSGITYYFASKAHKELFVKEPDKYEPEYGGWCAYAMGNDAEKVTVDPETFKIVNGKLFLFYNSFFSNTLKLWNKDEPGLKERADANWRKIISKK